MKGVRFARLKLEMARLRFHDASKITKTCSIGGETFKVLASNPRELLRIYMYMTREPDTVKWINEYVKPGDVFYDIGANTGLYSLLAAKRPNGHAEVYSFEPESQNYASLNQNVYLNGLSDNVKTFCLALSDASRIDSFYVHRYMFAGASIHQFGSATNHMGNPFSPVHQQGMMGVSLDDLCFKYGLAFPAHIKIDVDGHEFAVIDGANKVLRDPRLQTVLIEITETPSRMGDIEDIFAKFRAGGFSLLKKAPTGSVSTQSYNSIFSRRTT